MIYISNAGQNFMQLLCTVFLASVTFAGNAVEIQVVSSGGFAEAYKELAHDYEKDSSNKLVSNWGPSMGETKNAIPLRLKRGENLDVVIMVGDALDNLMMQGQLVAGSKVLLANSPIACAVKSGTKKYDISTVDNLRKTLLEVKSFAYSDSASGEYIKIQLLNKLGIFDQMQGKARKIPATPVGEIVANGDAEFGCQQRSEIMAVKGIDMVGLLPKEVQLNTIFSAAVVQTSKIPKEAGDFLKYISSPLHADKIRATGLDPLN